LKQCKKFIDVFLFSIIFVNIQKFIFIIIQFIVFFCVKLCDLLLKRSWRLYKISIWMFVTECTKTFEPIPELLKSKFDICKKKYENVFLLICSFNNLFRAI
jgi:hypothetical protein